MDLVKSLFQSKYKKLLQQLKVDQSNKKRVQLDNGIILNFATNEIEYDKTYITIRDLEW